MLKKALRLFITAIYQQIGQEKVNQLIEEVKSKYDEPRLLTIGRKLEA